MFPYIFIQKVRYILIHFHMATISREDYPVCVITGLLSCSVIFDLFVILYIPCIT